VVYHSGDIIQILGRMAMGIGGLEIHENFILTRIAYMLYLKYEI